MRKLALVSAFLVGLLPGWAFALGLGDLELNSFLNQPVDAEIGLIAGAAENLDSVRVRLASPAEFARAGIQYQDSLRQLRFSLAHKPDGAPYIKVHSNDPYREPFLNFLVEVSWSKGHILRQYTALVDPPVLVPQEAPPVTRTAQASAPAAAPRAPAAAPSAPVAEDDRFPRIPLSSERAPAPAPRAASTPARQPAGRAHEYGPTRRNDTLWRIAQEVRPDDSVTMEQMMLALLRENPEAFIGNNINRLKAGYVLRIPERAAIASMSARQARAETQRQYQAWKAAKAGPAQARPQAAEPQTAEAAQASEGELKLLAPRADTEAAEAAAGTGTGASGEGAALQKRLALAREAAEAQRQENEELQAQLNQLEEQVRDLEKLATLKDSQLAALQQQLAKLKERQAAPAAEADAGEAPATEVPATEAAVEEPEAEAATEEPEAGEEAVAADTEGGGAEQAPAEATAEEGQGANRYAVSGYRRVEGDEQPPEQDAAPPQEAAAPAEPAPAGQESGGMQGYLQAPLAIANQAWSYAQANPLVAGGGGVAVLALLLAGLMARQRRRAGAFQESILDDPRPALEPAAPAPAQAPAGERAQGQQPASSGESYISDFAISSMDSIQSEVSEADPLTEADVFLAYGRFQPAEAMIKEAIENEPGRMDLKAKLLEIYHAARNAEVFQKEAQALYDSLEDKSDPVWAKVAEMGRDLAPDNPLFGDGGPEPAEAATEMPGAAAAEMPAETLGDDELERVLGEELATGEPPAAEAEPAAPGEAAEEAPAGEAEDNLIDFDLGEFEGAGAAEPEAAEEQEGEELSDADDFGLDFELDMESAQAAAQEPEPQQAGGGEEPEPTERLSAELTDELSELTGSLEAEPAESESAETEDTARYELDLDDMDTEVLQDLGAEEAAGEAEAQGDTEVIEGALPDVDEVGTKLDLAKAYIDMGDPEGARSILDEVLEEGTDDQKGEAEELMQQIS